MTKEEFKKLKPGDVVMNNGSLSTYIVSGNYGNRVTAVITIDLTNPSEWELLYVTKEYK